MDTRRSELGTLVRRAREAGKFGTQPQLAEKAGISPRKVSDVERGQFAGRKTYEAIELVFHWPPGSMQDFLEGGPDPAAPSSDAQPVDHDWTPEEVERARGMTVEEIITEGQMIGKYSGEEAQLRYLRTATSVKLDQPVKPA